MKFHLVEREVQQLEVWQVWNLKREVQESVCRQLAFFRRISDDILIYLVGKSNFEILDLWDGQNSAGDVQGSYRKQKTTPAFRDLLKFVILWWFSRYLRPTNLFRKRCEPVLVEEEGLQVAGEQDWLINCVWICWEALKRDSRKCVSWQILKYVQTDDETWASWSPEEERRFCWRRGRASGGSEIKPTPWIGLDWEWDKT